MVGTPFFNYHGRLSVQGRRGGGASMKHKGGACRHITPDMFGGYKTSCGPSCKHCLSPASSSHRTQMIIAWSGPLILDGKPSLWTKADFQRESLLNRVKDQDLHFNLCLWKRKSVWDLWMWGVIYFQGPQRGYRRLGDTVSCRLLRKSSFTGPNCLTAIRARWWAAGRVKL